MRLNKTIPSQPAPPWERESCRPQPGSEAALGAEAAGQGPSLTPGSATGRADCGAPSKRLALSDAQARSL